MDVTRDKTYENHTPRKILIIPLKKAEKYYKYKSFQRLPEKQ
jgi:hypothetical protein